MPRGRQAARRGNSNRGAARGGRAGPKFTPFSGTSSPKAGHNGFTLAEEALNTERHQSHWDSDQKLRYSKVNFVSAGNLSKDDSQDNNRRDTESAMADMTLDSPQQQFEIEVEVEEDQQTEGLGYDSRLLPTAPATMKNSLGNVDPRVAASGWADLPARIQAEARESARQQDAELAQKREIQEIGFASEVTQPVYKNTWRQVALNEDDTRSKVKASWTTVKDGQGNSSVVDFGNTRIDTATSQDHSELSTTAPADFIVDTHGEAIDTGLPPPRVRSTSPTPSNSSEEVILFAGRNNKSRGFARNVDSAQTVEDPFDVKIKIIEDKIHQKEELLEEIVHRRIHSPPFCDEIMTRYSGETQQSRGFGTVSSRRRNRGPGRHRGRKSGRSIHKEEEEEAIIADYLANIDSDDREAILQSSSLNNRELGGTDDDGWQDEAEISSGEPRPSKEHLKGSWDTSNIEDLDDLSTSDGVMGEVQGIFSKRERKSGVQYLVVWEDQTMDEARWVPVTTLTSVTAQAHIKEFEAEEKLVTQFAAVSDDEDDNDDDSIGSDDEDEDVADEKDLLQRKIDQMDDEQIARLLAKQEELGMGSDELLLFDDAGDADEEEVFTVPRGDLNFMLPSTKKTRSKRPRRDFPAATALADAYDGFDVMNFERPSLKKKPKGRKGKLILDDVSDSELEESMRTAWDNDRIKKKERKQEREELRAQGLLGRKNCKPDLKQKYKEGMGFSDVKEEIKRFLMGSDTTLALPPMDKADRKIVHEIANVFNLKSKSVGTGKNRSPILYRTHRTIDYVERTFSQVESRLARRFMPRMDVGWNKTGPGHKKPARTGGGGFSKAAVSYQDGDIVGGSAPELGAENRGRAMLEKMGWSSGTALGALNNKGILQPVSHVVKTTKAGLG